MRRFAYFFLILAAFGPSAPARAADIMAPDALAMKVTDEVLAVVRADKDIQAGDTKKVLALVETKVLPHFDFTRMTRLAMGKNWRAASDEQKEELIQAFRTLLVRTYTAAFTVYRNETVEYRPLRMREDDTDVVVKSLVHRSSGRPVAIDYSMVKTPRGWKVYNVKIEGISLVENYRNTFNAEVRRSGVAGLIKVLNSKNDTP